METLQQDKLLEKVNEKYQDVLDVWYRDIKGFETAVQFTNNISLEALNAFKIVNAMVHDMMSEHIIEELNWNGEFIPQYDWMGIDLKKVNAYAEALYDVEDYYPNLDLFSKCLLELSHKGVVKNFVWNASNEHGWFNMELIGFNSEKLEEFNRIYSNIRYSINYFHSN